MPRRLLAGSLVPALMLAFTALAGQAAAQPLTVASSGVGGLGPDTPFTRAAVAAALPGYRVVKGRGMSEGEPFPLFEARRHGRTVLRVMAARDGRRVGKVSVDGPGAETAGGVRVLSLIHI